MQTKKTKAIIISTVIILLVGGFALAQPRGGQQRDRGGNQRGGGDRPDFMNMTPEQRQKFMEDRMADRMKETLEISDAEWTALKPYVTKVMQLSRDASGFGGMRGGPGGMMGGRGGRGGDRGQRPDSGNQSAVQKATEALNQVLESNNPSNEDIKSKLAALRSARAKAEQELLKAQGELRQLLTVKQEAILVARGMLK